MGRRILWAVTALLLLGVAVLAGWRLARQPTSPPLYASGNLLVNPGFQEDADGDRRPDGWDTGPAAELSDWTIVPEPGGHSLRLTGSASYVRSAPIAVRPGKRYTLSLQALADASTPARLQAVFLWEDTRREVYARATSPWLSVPARRWHLLSFAAEAPQDAAGLTVLLRPAGDDPVYLDDLRLCESGVRLEPFPDYTRAALAFTVDWETAMGGLIHSRSDDGYNPATAEARGLAMRRGTENLLSLFERFGIRGTWYAAGYALLPGNTARDDFGHPLYTWASRANGWRDDRWVTTSWFADDPYGTAETHPAWYFGDLVPRLLAAHQEIASHTFGHLYLGLASPEELRADLHRWNSAAQAVGVPLARSLAFPWGASLGMPDASYDVLKTLGYIAVTRTYHEPRGRSQYWILPPDDLFHMRTVPGHPDLWAFPDHYFPGDPQELPKAQAVIDRVLLLRGVTSLWAHSEEVASPEQEAAWEELLAYAADRRAAGLWIAPLTEIVRFHNALSRVDLQERERPGYLEVQVHNGSKETLSGLTLTFPAPVRRATLDGASYGDFRRDQLRLPELRTGATVRLKVWLEGWEGGK
ncbi:MAG: polysaccharide deacetylase family protein [Chloroflexia bacterium]